MKVTRYRPFLDLKNFEDKFFSYDKDNNVSNISSFAPMVNTREDEKSYYVEIDLPGVRKEDISIDVEKNHLLISGERKFKTETKEEDYYKTESFFGKFQRSFSLPETVDIENIQAKCENGVLEIIIPKIEPKEAKKIQISWYLVQFALDIFIVNNIN